MRPSHRFNCLLLPALLCLPLIPGQKKPDLKLPEQYRLWLEEEVVYIITPTERDVFRKLETDRERDIFIEAFWKHRDPTPGTPGNEFKEEHYRRLSYAKEYYGRGTPLPGWKTDRGRIYIILGPPQNIETYDTTTGVYPTEIWFYPGDPAYGLPTAFNIIFFKRSGTGDYILYSPVDDGPQALIADDMGESARDERAIYQKLAKLAPNLAPQTLSLIPGERVMSGTVSLASTQLLGNIFSYPQKKVEDTYAEALLKYKDVIEVDYSANYLASDSFVSIIRDPSGCTLVHYSVEPRRIAVNQSGNTYTAHFELDGRVSDDKGNTVFQYVKDFPLTFNGDQIKNIEATSLAIQDMFPLVAGTYRFDLLLKNTVSKAFTSTEATLVVPGDNTPLRLGQLVLGYRLDRGGATSPDFIPFKTSAGQLLVQARKTFSRKDDLNVFSQIFGLTEELRAGGRLKFDLLKKDAPFLTRTKGIAEYENVPDILEVFPLGDFPPDYYRVKLAILDRDGREVLAQDEDFEVTALPDIPRPLVVSKVMPASGAGEYDYEMGLQLLNLKRSKDALVYLEKAFTKNPEQLKYALGLCQGLFIEAQYQRAKDILSPWRGEKATDLVLYFHGKSAHSLGQLDDAIADYTDYISRFGLNLEILNLLGNAHYQNGNAAEALRTWKRSLEINPNQENIKKLVQSIEEKTKR
jgi:GWxTD domain-containing protein